MKIAKLIESLELEVLAEGRDEFSDFKRFLSGLAQKHSIDLGKPVKDEPGVFYFATRDEYAARRFMDAVSGAKDQIPPGYDHDFDVLGPGSVPPGMKAPKGARHGRGGYYGPTYYALRVFKGPVAESISGRIKSVSEGKALALPAEIKAFIPKILSGLTKTASEYLDGEFLTVRALKPLTSLKSLDFRRQPGLLVFKAPTPLVRGGSLRVFLAQVDDNTQGDKGVRAQTVPDTGTLVILMNKDDMSETEGTDGRSVASSLVHELTHLIDPKFRLPGREKWRRTYRGSPFSAAGVDPRYLNNPVEIDAFMRDHAFDRVILGFRGDESKNAEDFEKERSRLRDKFRTLKPLSYDEVETFWYKDKKLWRKYLNTLYQELESLTYEDWLSALKGSGAKK